MSKYHESVLLDKVIEYLEPGPEKTYIDATAGGGGHCSELVKRGAKVLALDQDPEAVEELSRESLENLVVVKSNFANIAKVAQEKGFEKVDGILFDLGVSSHQLDTASRGFSFTNSGPLDMRMDPDLTLSAESIVNNFDKRRLNEIFKVYGQEKFSLAIADAVLSAREVKPIENTRELGEIVREVYRRKRMNTKLHPATKVFQALRIVVNSELLNLEEALPQTTKLLGKGGRLVVISFHSLEDGIVKRFFKQATELEILTKLPVGPGNSEQERNQRSRSAKLRAAQKR